MHDYVLAAVVISGLLHASAAVWWLSRQAQIVEMPGVQEVTVSLISPEPPAPEPVAVPPPAPPETPEPQPPVEEPPQAPPEMPPISPPAPSGPEPATAKLVT